MRLPAALYGPEQPVRERAAEMAGRIARGESLVEVLGPEKEDEVRGLIVLQSGSPLIRDEDAHRTSVLHERLDPRDDALFEATLRAPWGVLAMLGQDTQPWVMPEARRRPFLEAALARAGELRDLDGTFTIGQPHGVALWDLPNNLRFVLARAGVPSDVLIDPDPPGGWPEIVSRALAD